MKTATALGALMVFACAAHAQSVALSGSMGERAALLLIDGQPRTVSVGNTVQGVRLLSVAGNEAMVEVGGRRLALRIGVAPVSGGGATARGQEIVLTAGPGGHFNTTGSINGKTVQFLVDTGATMIGLSQAEANRIGLDYRNGERGMVQTANGAVPAHVVNLNSVRIGDVEVSGIQAIVTPGSMPFVLLGNSFLTRFQMRRENDVMRLEKRP
jgi:aspartyl protease family protein